MFLARIEKISDFFVNLKNSQMSTHIINEIMIFSIQSKTFAFDFHFSALVMFGEQQDVSIYGNLNGTF